MEILKSYKLFTIICLFCVCISYSQNTNPDTIYRALDDFLLHKESNSRKTLLQLIDSNVNNNKELQLARTVAYCNIAYIDEKQGKLQDAILYYEKAKKLYFSDNLEGYDIIEYCLKPLGNLYTKTQAFTESENTIKHYILYAQETKQKDQEIAGIINLSVLYHNRGDYKKSIAILKQAEKNTPRNLNIQLNLATAYFATNDLDKTKSILSNMNIETLKTPKAYILLAQVNLKEKNYENAIHNLQAAIEKTPDTPRELAKIHLAIAETYYRQNAITNAKISIQQVYNLLLPTYEESERIPSKKQLYPETTLMEALDLQAAIYIDENDNQKAWNTYLLAEEVNEMLFIHLHQQESKLLMQQNLRRRGEKMLTICYNEYTDYNDVNRLERAIQIDSKNKSRVVTDAMEQKQILGQYHNEDILLYQELEQQLASVKNELYHKTHLEDFNAEDISELQKSYSNLLTEQKILQEKIQSYLYSKDLEPIKLKALQKKAAHNKETLVSYFMGDQSIYQFIISKDILRFKKLTNNIEEYEEFRNQIRQFNRLFENQQYINNDVKTFKETARTLYKLLDLPNNKKLIVIPDGILSFVPFQTLLSKDSNTSEYARMPFLIYESQITYLLTLKDYNKPINKQSRKDELIGFFPIFSNSELELQFSEKEADAIEELYPSLLYKNKEATAEKFINKAKDAYILHISTHAFGGTFNEEASILFSDRAFLVHELYTLNTSANLVVLSACDTGIGRLIKGEGAQSLARGFQYAGVENVFFSLWQVNDKSTSELMHYFYDNLKRKKSKSFATQQASINYLEDPNVDNIMKSPFYWGAFVYYGSTESIENRNWWPVICLGVLALVILGIRIRRKVS